MFNFKKDQNTIKGKKPSYLAVDIGTEFVKTALFVKDVNEVQIIGYNRVKQKESNMYAAFILDMESVTDTVDKCIGETIKNAQNILSSNNISLPKEAVVGIAGELVQGATILVNIDRKNPEKPIDKRELDSLISKVKENTFESTKEEIALEAGISPSQMQEIDTYINSVFIDGVRVTNPMGYKGSEVVYRVFSTFAPRIHIESLNRVISGLGLNLSKLVVEPYAISLALSDLRTNDSSGIIIDVGGGTTDVALVQNGDIIGTKMFAIGGRVFTKRIEKDFGLDYEEAEKMKIDYSNKNLSDSVQLKISKLFQNDIKVWISGVEIALQDFEDVTEYPPNIYICGGGAMLPEIQEELLSHPWLQVLNFKKYPKVNFVYPASLSSVVDRTKTATKPDDVAPLSLSRMIL